MTVSTFYWGLGTLIFTIGGVISFTYWYANKYYPKKERPPFKEIPVKKFWDARKKK